MARKTPGRRPRRVAELIREEIGRLLVEEVSDPRIGFVTVTRVEMSADLSSAKIFVSVLGTDAQQRTTLRGLKSARGRIQAALGGRLVLRRTPEISFHIDDGVKRSIRMSSLLSELARERGEPPSETDDTWQDEEERP